MNTVYKLRVELIYSEPTIWREFYVDGKMLLPNFHIAIQVVMGWKNAHLHQFIHNRTFYGMPDPYDELDTVDYQKIKLSDLLIKKGDQFIYEYDFGDSWAHTITLQNIEVHRKIAQLPYCDKGERACPPEDCGGIPGYENLIRVLSDPKDEEYEDMMMWLGGNYDPKTFDLDTVNKALKLNFK